MKAAKNKKHYSPFHSSLPFEHLGQSSLFTRVCRLFVNQITFYSILELKQCPSCQVFLKSHLFPSLWTLLLLAGNFCPGGIEKSCLRHKYSFPIALTARQNCKKSATFSITLVICCLEKFCCSIHHHFLHSDHSQTKKKNIIIKKWRQTFPLTWNFLLNVGCR